MADAEIKVRGYEQLADGTKQLAQRIEGAAGREMQAVASQVAGTVSSRVPRRTGALAASLAVEATDAGALVRMGEGVPYAGYVEYGGRGHPSSPQGNFLYPTAQESLPMVQDAGESAAQREIGAMHWPSPT